MLNENANDIINILSFLIGLENLELNITQNDLQEQTSEIDERANKLVQSAIDEIHAHLEQQDDKIERIIKLIYEINQKN